LLEEDGLRVIHDVKSRSDDPSLPSIEIFR
jgi:hypothetical protein